MERIIKRSLYNFSLRQPTIINSSRFQSSLTCSSPQRSLSTFSFSTQSLNLETPFTITSLPFSFRHNIKKYYSTQSNPNNVNIKQKIKEIISEYKILKPNIVEETLGTTTTHENISVEKINFLLSQYNRDPYYEIVWRIFDLLRNSDTLRGQLQSSTYSIVISSLAARNRFTLASSLFREFENPDIELYETFLEACGRTNHYREGVRLFHEMIEKRLPIRPKTVYTFQVSILFRDILFKDQQIAFRALDDIGLNYQTLLDEYLKELESKP